MPYSDEELGLIYDKTEGYCYYCGKRLSFVNYNQPNCKGAWHVEHSVPKAKGGTDYLRNRVPACINCNIDKGVLRGTYYKRKYEPATIGGAIVEALGLPPGFMGASRRKCRK